MTEKSSAKTKVDQDLIRDLARLLNETDLTEIEIEQQGLRVRVARTPAPVHAAMPMPAAMPIGTPARSEAAVPLPADVPPASHPGAVLSPMVGTAYRAAEPGGKVFVEEGDVVREGQTLVIIEAMKTMNQIPAPRAGTVRRILVEDGRPVEYGEPLMIVE